ncbi:MAG: cysteine desulfurase [Deltaproteobacteria bacterium]|nr:cysteine desulfurase [Deltaproteobacteria bacterium]
MTTYLDNAATTVPKPPSVYEAVRHAMERIGATPGRGAHRLEREASAMVAGAREKVARLLDIPDARRVLFTKNATESINLVLKGWLRSGDRVVISGMEHNAVVRPIERLKATGVGVDIVPCPQGGRMDMEAFQTLLQTPPRLAVLTHASNVNGGLLPVNEVAKMCREQGVPLLLDAAQTAGVQTISVGDWQLGMLACSGHKGLLGPPGVGILYIRPDLDVLPLIEGGTGSLSEQADQPRHSPDRYESGTPNLPGIAGLAAGIDFIAETGVDSILKHELGLAATLERELAGLPGVRVFKPDARGTGVVSFLVEGLNPGDVGYLLDAGFDIAVRTGLHCAPLAHRSLGTFPEGTVRVSPGFSTTPDEIEYFLNSLRSLLSKRR